MTDDVLNITRTLKVAVAVEVMARCMWPPIGSAWEVAVAVSGGVCYRHTDTDAVQWAPPPGSLVTVWWSQRGECVRRPRVLWCLLLCARGCRGAALSGGVRHLRSTHVWACWRRHRLRARA